MRGIPAVFFLVACVTTATTSENPDPDPEVTETSGIVSPLTGEEADQSCEVDDDCVKVYSDCSYCDCDAVNAGAAWGYGDLDCSTWDGAMCDYDCVWSETEWAECHDGACVVVSET